MTFVEMLATFLGRTVEVMVPNQLIEGTLIRVETTLMQVQEPPTVYGQPGIVVSIPYLNVDFVRVLV